MPPFCYMQNDNEAQSALNIYFPHHFGSTCYADCKRSVSDLRFNICIFLAYADANYRELNANYHKLYD